MSITYPLTFPTDIDFRASRFGLNVMQSTFEASTSRQVLTQNFNGGLNDIWEGVWTTQKLDETKVAKLSAWLTSLNGRQGTFYAYDPDRRYPLGSISYSELTCDSTDGTCDTTAYTCDNGAPSLTVDGASQTGKTLSVTSDETSVTGALLAGSYINIGSQLHILTADLDLDASGDGTLCFEPVMKSIPTNGSDVVYLLPVMTARLAAPFKGWDTDQNKFGEFSFAFEEVV